MPNHAKVNEFKCHLDSEEPIRALVSQSGFVYLKFAIEQFIQCYFCVEIPIVSDSNKLSESYAADEEIDAAEIVVDGRDDQAVARPDEACNRIEGNEWKGKWILLTSCCKGCVLRGGKFVCRTGQISQPGSDQTPLDCGGPEEHLQKDIHNTYGMVFSSGL